ncbi:hypothetical protein FHY18_004317 [Xanthomonas arboricola]|uniref:hypothetical protein n=1 Tax=Xanthomonas sp. 3793 TaxID=3035312 RepID=UPI00216A375A|nr:hypothetical protein [Xanthomonas sp. 3793]MCS3748678.1 hypothetical protein [Xanthomonas sp. 3793]
MIFSALFARAGVDVTADFVKITWNGMLNAGGAPRNYLQVPLLGFYMQYGISGSLTMTAEECAYLLVATAASLVGEVALLKVTRLPATCPKFEQHISL